jgi:hypothetical protein
MKRNWLTYVAITASLIAGFLCSTALADNKGMKFSGGSMRSFQGGGGGGGGGGLSRNLQLQSNNQFRNLNIQSRNLQSHNLQTQNFSGIKSQIKSHGLQGHNLGIHGNNQGIQTQIQRGNLQGGQLGQILGNANGNKPLIKINPGTQINGGNHNATPGIKIGGTGIKVGGTNNGLGITLGNNNVRTTIGHLHANGGNKSCHVAPKCIDPCFSKGCSPFGNTCSPCLKNWTVNCVPWWWNCHTHYCNKPIYYPVCTRPIVIPVPVYVGVPAVQERLVQVPVGATITMQAQGLGDVAGRLVLVMDKVSLEGQVNEWQPAAVTATLPMFDLAAPTPAELVIVRADGQPATSMKVELIPAQPAAAQPVAGAVQQAQAIEPVAEISAAAALVQ